MRQRIFYPLYFALVLCTALLFVSCASVGRKERAVHSYQTIHAAIASVQDIERAACIPATDATKCTSALAPKFGLTDAKHVEINKALSDAFALEIKVGDALKAWKAGDPPPTDLAALSAVASQILKIAEGFAPADSDARRILENATRLVASVQAIADALGGK
jgi:hypothetical protein